MYILLKSRFRRRNKINGKVACSLLEKAWGLGDLDPSKCRSAAYIRHCESLLLNRNLIDGHNLTLQSSDDVVDLVALVKADRLSTLQQLKDRLRVLAPHWLRNHNDGESAQRAIEFAVRLWLFTNISFTNPGATLQDAVRSSLPERHPPLSTPALLPADFSAKSLERKGGFVLAWTSDLCEHLTFHSDNRLLVFRHAYVLHRYSTTAERDMYPADLLQETERTLRLLFDIGPMKTSKRVRRIAEKHEVDIEAQIENREKFQLSTYVFYGGRLAEVQRRYNAARPHALKQWWYDRRETSDWATLWIAALVLILTILFGIVTIILGSLQVYASFRAIEN